MMWDEHTTVYSRPEGWQLLCELQVLGWLRQGCGHLGKMPKAPAVFTLAISFLTYRFVQGPLVSLALGNINLHLLRLSREELGDSCRASHPNPARPRVFREPGCLQGPTAERQRSQMNISSTRTVTSSLQKGGLPPDVVLKCLHLRPPSPSEDTA